MLLAAAPADVTYVQQPDASADLAGVQVLLQAGLDRQTSRQNGLASLVAETILRTPVQGTPLEDAVKAAGGSVSFSSEPRRMRFYVESSSQAFPAVLQLLHDALAHPDFTPATLADARTHLNDLIARDQTSALRVGIDMLNRAFYQNSDAGLPRYGLSETLAGFASTDARAFYNEHYRRGDAVVSAAGAIPAGTPPASVVDGLPAGTSAAVAIKQGPLPSTSRQIIARRDVPVPWLVAQYRAPDMSSRDFGAMLILTEFMQRTLSEVSDVPGIATRPAAQRGVGAFYNFDSSPANVILYVDGGLGDPSRAFSTALGVVGVLGQARLGGDLAELKNFAIGRLLEDSQTLEDRSFLAAVYASHHLTGDYRTELVKAINATKPADLQRVASRYLSTPTIALVLPRSQQTQ